MLNLKKVLLTVSLLAAYVSSFAIHEEFAEGYEFVPSSASTKVKELPMSFYKDGKVDFSTPEFKALAEYVKNNVKAEGLPYTYKGYGINHIFICQELTPIH